MKRMTFTAITFGMMAIITAVAISQSTTIRAQNPPVEPVGVGIEGHEPSLVGVWVTQVTRRNCETGEPIAATGRIQLTFAEGGTFLETIGPSILRSPGNGIWKREHGWNEYSSALRFMRFDAAGVFVGSGVVRAAITLDETGDHYTSTATNDVLDVNGNVIGSGCATSVSTRFSME
ncbi:MAG: hypothetical protein H0W28_05875 [Pyrinomonadaceae bacterium]|nr:hypothetical protein [Pyrinomonadaceae bacterium]